MRICVCTDVCMCLCVGVGEGAREGERQRRGVGGREGRMSPCQNCSVGVIRNEIWYRWVHSKLWDEF
jgi:hypothetical protein